MTNLDLYAKIEPYLDLEDKKTEIYEAVKDSFKIVDFVKERYIDKALEKTNHNHTTNNKKNTKNREIW